MFNKTEKGMVNISLGIGGKKVNCLLPAQYFINICINQPLTKKTLFPGISPPNSIIWSQIFQLCQHKAGIASTHKLFVYVLLCPSSVWTVAESFSS